MGLRIFPRSSIPTAHACTHPPIYTLAPFCLLASPPHRSSARPSVGLPERARRRKRSHQKYITIFPLDTDLGQTTSQSVPQNCELPKLKINADVILL